MQIVREMQDTLRRLYEKREGGVPTATSGSTSRALD
jgi:hypothetical protein